jgi:hypothetical protein
MATKRQPYKTYPEAFKLEASKKIGVKSLCATNTRRGVEVKRVMLQ